MTIDDFIHFRKKKIIDKAVKVNNVNELSIIYNYFFLKGNILERTLEDLLMHLLGSSKW